MNKKEINKSKQNNDARLNNILTYGKEIGYFPILTMGKYYLLDNVIWYVSIGTYPICEGTLEEFKNKIKNNMIKIKLTIDINKL